MKMTIVIDTDDSTGIRDAYKIVAHFHKRVDTGSLSGREVRYGKIGLIKMLRAFARQCKLADRAFARQCKLAEARDDDSTSLKFSKLFADEIFIEKYGL